MPVNTVNFFSQDPAQLVALQQQQMRAQQLAQALQQQSMEPIQSPSGGGKVSWTQGLAKVLGAVLAQKEGKQANDLQQQIAQQQAQQVRSQLAALNAGDTPATPPSIKPGVIPPASIALPADQQPPLTNQEINPGTPAMPGRPTAEALAAALAALVEATKSQAALAELDYMNRKVSPFDPIRLLGSQVRANPMDRTPPSDKMVAALERFGIKDPRKYNANQCGKLIKALLERADAGLCSLKQYAKLEAHVPVVVLRAMSFKVASDLITELAANGWRRPGSWDTDPRLSLASGGRAPRRAARGGARSADPASPPPPHTSP